jgi:hypothetical protein
MIDPNIKDVKFTKKYFDPVRIMTLFICIVLFLFTLIVAAFFITSCTLSFQNISTHGTATDLVDEDLTTSPKTDGTLNMAPLK